MKKTLTLVFCTLIFFSCSSDKNLSDKDSFDNSNVLYVHLDDIEVKVIDGKQNGYYEGKPFTGILVFTRNNTAVKELRVIKDGLGTGISRSYRGNKTTGQITTENGMQYRLPIMNSETTTDKEIVYFDNSKQVEIESEGYLNRDLQGNFLGFIQEGKCTYYKKDGSVSRVTEYQNDREIE